MADGSIVIPVNVDDQKAQGKLTKLNQKIAKIKSDLAVSESNKSAIEEQLNKAKNAALQAEKAVAEYKKELSETTAATGGNDPFSESWSRALEEAKKELAEQDKIAKELGTKYAAVTDKINSQKVELQAAKDAAAEQQAKLAGVQFPESVLDAEKHFRDVAEDAGKALENASKSAAKISPKIRDAGSKTKKLSPAAERAEKSFGKLAARIKGLAKRVFIFTIITAALRRIKQYMWAAIQTNDDAMNAVARLKGELHTLAQPIVNIAIPAFTALAKIITYTLTGASRLLSLLFGSTYIASKKAAKSLNDQQNAIEGVGSAAKKASKYLAPFDELNTISGGDAGSGSESGGNAVNFDSDIGSGVNAVMALMTGVALLAIGAILTFSGHVGLGISMMVAGALTVYGVYASDGGDAAKTLVETGLSKILIAIGPMIAILGVVLMMTGNIPMGLGLLIAGIALFAVGEVAENWDLLSTNLVGALANMLIDISPYIALFGAVLLFVPGQQALGIGLIIAGIALFAVGEVAANWELLGQNMTEALTKIFRQISPYIVVFGLLLAMVPGMMALGIGMIIAGVAMFAVSAIAPNWDSITQALRGPLGKTLAMIGGFLVVLGLMLIFSGVGIPLGIGMLLAGGVSLAAAIAPNWNYITDKIKEVWKNIRDFWNSKIAPIFTSAWWRSKGKDMLNGLAESFETGLNRILGGVSKFINGITGMLNAIPGVNIRQVDWSNAVHIPRLAQGAVIPANREFLAVLGDQKHGTNIEAPADLIRQIVREEVKNSGGVNHITIVLDSVNGKKIFDTVVKENNAVVRATGASPLVV